MRLEPHTDECVKTYSSLILRTDQYETIQQSYTRQGLLSSTRRGGYISYHKFYEQRNTLLVTYHPHAVVPVYNIV